MNGKAWIRSRRNFPYLTGNEPSAKLCQIGKSTDAQQTARAAEDQNPTLISLDTPQVRFALTFAAAGAKCVRTEVASF